MAFRIVKDAIVNNVLGPAEAGRYQTIGYQRQVKDAAGVLDNSRLVQLYYSGGSFPKSSGPNTGPTMHDMSFSVELTVAKAAAGDLSVINNPSSTPAQIAAALLAFNESAALADASLDELFDIVYQVLMDGRNIDFGLPVGTIANRWVDQLDKDLTEPRGLYVVLTGSMRLTCRAAEEILGTIGVPGDKVYDFNLEIPDDDIQKTGKSGPLGGN